MAIQDVSIRGSSSAQAELLLLHELKLKKILGSKRPVLYGFCFVIKALLTLTYYLLASCIFTHCYGHALRSWWHNRCVHTWSSCTNSYSNSSISFFQEKLVGHNLTTCQCFLCALSNNCNMSYGCLHMRVRAMIIAWIRRDRHSNTHLTLHLAFHLEWTWPRKRCVEKLLSMKWSHFEEIVGRQSQFSYVLAGLLQLKNFIL